MVRWVGLAVIPFLLASTSVAVELVIPLTEGAPGSAVQVGIDVFRDGTDVAEIGSDILFGPPLRVPSNDDGSPKCRVNELEHGLAGSFVFLPIGCLGPQCVGVRLRASSDPPIARNITFANCTVEIAADTAPGFYELPLQNGSAVEGNGTVVVPSLVSEGVSVPELPRRATIFVGSAEGRQGGSAEFKVILDTTIAARIERVGVRIATDPLTNIPFDEMRRAFCAINPDIDKDRSFFVGNPAGGVSAEVLGSVKLIPTGSVLFTCPVNIDPNTPPGSYPLACIDSTAYDSTDGFIATDCVTGFLEVLRGLPGTPTSTPTPSPTPTSTATQTTKSKHASLGCSVSNGPSETFPAATWLGMMLVGVARQLRRKRCGLPGTVEYPPGRSTKSRKGGISVQNQGGS